jgi:hypothetical protein
MESYKHSCPFCGQHIEYTAGYCGTQMDCPTCGKNVTFPAIPPGGKRQPLHIKRPRAAEAARRSFNFNAILAALRQFEHWNMVLICLVPFLIVTGLLVGATVVRNKAGEGPAAPVAPSVQVDPNAWQKVTDLTRADLVVQEKINAVAAARNAVARAERESANLHAYYQGKALDPATCSAMSLQYAAKDQAVANAKAVLSTARNCFDTAFQNYQKLGGTADYRQQLPQ